MYKMRNIDSFIPERFEKIGMLKGKRWYIDPSKSKSGLFKPKRYEFKDRTVFCANHYGEFIGYVLAERGGIEACETEMAHLSKYYSNIHKERNNGTPEEKDGCIIYSLLEKGDILEPGKITIERFRSQHREQYEDIIKKEDLKTIDINDNIEVIFSAVKSRVEDFYEMLPNNSKNYTQLKVQQVRNKLIEMMVYDCLYGNYDRHDENWSMHLKANGDIDLYKLYDKEKVLGLYENQNFIEEALREDEVEKVSEEKFFSRMRIPGENKKYSTYKDVLNYLMHTYPDETQETLKRQLEGNNQENIKECLENCEGLPKAFIDFGTKMYRYRENFAKELLEINKNYDNINER